MDILLSIVAIVVKSVVGVLWETLSEPIKVVVGERNLDRAARLRDRIRESRLPRKPGCVGSSG